jgi:hypothetical protein
MVGVGCPQSMGTVQCLGAVDNSEGPKLITRRNHTHLGSRKPGYEQPRKGDQGRLHPSPKQEQADHSRYIMQGRPEGRGNGLMHMRPLPRRRMNPRPQAFPTLIHCPDSSQHHDMPDHLTDRRRRVYQPQVPLLVKQRPPCRVLTWDRNCVLWVPPPAPYYRLPVSETTETSHYRAPAV